MNILLIENKEEKNEQKMNEEKQVGDKNKTFFNLYMATLGSPWLQWCCHDNLFRHEQELDLNNDEYAAGTHDYKSCCRNSTLPSP